MYGSFPNTGKPDFDQKLAKGDNWPENSNHRKKNNGIFYCATEIGRNDVTDGLSNTYMVGEKFVDAKAYAGVAQCRGDNESMYVGHDPDILRWCYGRTAEDYDAVNNDANLKGSQDLLFEKGDKNAYTVENFLMPPLHDVNNVPGGFPWQNYFWRFGSAHASSLNMAFADASVHRVHYGIEGQIHALHGSRKDGQMIPDTKEIK
jgi:hypothetical protein